MALHIGTAGWSYPDWRGTVYPASRKTGFNELSYIAAFFNTIEINTTFYRIPAQAMVENWAARVQKHKNFKFCVKLWNAFTHGEEIPSRDTVKQFKDALSPLEQAGKMGVLLVQFPWRFKKDKKNIKHLLEVTSQFDCFTTVVEFRHASWMDRMALDLLRDTSLAFANIDQPVIGRSIPLTAHVTAPVTYLRLHGRNYKTWFAKDSGRDARYDYLYSESEIESWRPTIESLTSQSEQTFIIFNNHFRGQAVVNALQLKAKLGNTRVGVPVDLIQNYPQLEKIKNNDEQATLF